MVKRNLAAFGERLPDAVVDTAVSLKTETRNKDKPYRVLGRFCFGSGTARPKGWRATFMSL